MMHGNSNIKFTVIIVLSIVIETIDNDILHFEIVTTFWLIKITIFTVLANNTHYNSRFQVMQGVIHTGSG